MVNHASALPALGPLTGRVGGRRGGHKASFPPPPSELDMM
jgi:hypothetical protein